MTKASHYPKDKHGRNDEKMFFNAAGFQEKWRHDAAGTPKKGNYHERRDVAQHNKVGRNIGRGH